jgi:hypothetical protein
VTLCISDVLSLDQLELRSKLRIAMILWTAFARRLFGAGLLLLGLFTLLVSASTLKNEERAPYGTTFPTPQHQHHVLTILLVNAGHNSGYESEHQNTFSPIHPPPSHNAETEAPPFSASAATNALQELHNALEVMQKEYFSLWLGKWTSAIEWTSAVMGTHISGTLYSLSHSLRYTMPGTFSKERKLDVEALLVENEINKYFSQSIAYFFGEEYFDLRSQANDDMLWVVLGWLESIQFINSHSDRHYPTTTSEKTNGNRQEEWHGSQYIPVFAHRARVFYELASQGWDWELCGGGMTWDPKLLPYKNAITNQLFISASISMYLHFPGDNNCSPFMGAQDVGPQSNSHMFKAHEVGECEEVETGKSLYDPIYLVNAINGYNWLKNSGMMNSQGLYVDGFHIRGYATNHSKTHCDERNEMVYTYNQGVVLSGLRGLWEATGNVSYLEDGHELVRDVIRATGWRDTELYPTSFASDSQPRKRRSDPPRPEFKPTWSGLGSNGILTELCDPSGLCSQDSHTFKGIFFHHLVSFCTPLPRAAVRSGRTHAADKATAGLHRRSCNEYAAWVTHNAVAAGRTRDSQGRFGMWWGAGLEDSEEMETEDSKNGAEEEDQTQTPKRNKQSRKRLSAHTPPAHPYPPHPADAIDYRNEAAQLLSPSFSHPAERPADLNAESAYERDGSEPGSDTVEMVGGDPNTRGRGRTIETQGGGVAVTRAMWEFLRRYDDDDDDDE